MSDTSTTNTLPADWQLLPLGAIAETQLGKMLNSSKQTGQARMPYLRNINLRWETIDLADVKKMDVFPDEIDKFTLRSGDVLVCEGGEPGRAAVWKSDEPMAFQNAIHRVRPKEGISSEFLSFQFEWLTKNGHLDKFFTGVTIKHFAQTRLRKAIFVVPPLAEQVKIIEFLEEQLSRLDAALASVRTVREKAAKFCRSLLHAAFTGALTGHDSLLGTPPAVWVKTEINEVAHINYGYTESATHDSIGPKFLRITDIQDGRVSWSEVPYCTISEKDEEKHRLASGDIVFARTGATTGKSFLVVNPPNAVCASYLIRLRPMGDKVLSEFLSAYFQSDTYWNQIRAGTTGTAQGGFNASKLAKLIMVLPSLVEQEKIVEILEEQLSRLDASLAVADAVEKRASALRRSLLHAAFTGQITKQWRESKS